MATLMNDTEYRLELIADKYDVPVSYVVDAMLDLLDGEHEGWEEELGL